MRAFAFAYDGKEINLATISESYESTRLLALDDHMGWRFSHPDRYDQAEAWHNLVSHGGRIVGVEITIVVGKETK